MCAFANWTALILASSDVEDFDPDAGFKKADDRWEGEDEELDVLTTKTEQATATSTSGAECKETLTRKLLSRRLTIIVF